MMRFPFAIASRTHFSGSPMRVTSSSIGFTYAGAPPCSGPDSAPTAAESAAPQLAPVDATTRAVRVEVVVDEQPPHVLVRDFADQRLDVDAAIAQHPALTIGLHDLRLDGDHSFEPRLEVVVAAHLASSSSISRPTDRFRAAASTRAAAAASWTATPTDLYRVI